MAPAELVYGRHPVLSYLKAMAARSRATAPISKILLATNLKADERLEEIQRLARHLKIPIQHADRRRLDSLAGSGASHQGVVAFRQTKERLSLPALMDMIESEKCRRASQAKNMDGFKLVLLDGIEDPHNLGAIVRVAEASGVKALLLPRRRSARLTAAVAKVSAGALASLPVIEIDSSAATIETLKAKGFWALGLDSSASMIYSDCDLVRPLILVIGAEGRGLGRLVKERCDLFLSIPMLGTTESLNASVATGIVLYEAVRQLKLEFDTV